MLLTFVVLLVGIALLPTLPGWRHVHRRLQRLGAWFPVVLWLATTSLMVACLFTEFRVHPVRGWFAFGALLLAPFCAALLTLAWRDARAPGRLPAVTPAAATHPPGTRAPGWVRKTCVLFGVLGAWSLTTAAWSGRWNESGLMVVFTGISGYIALTGRLPAWLASRVG